MTFERGVELETEGNTGAAEAIYRGVISQDPDFAPAYINLGTILYDRQSHAEAESCYRMALIIDPDYALAHFDIANVLDETGRVVEAKAHYLKSIALAPPYPDAHYNLALLCEKTGARSEALKHWREYVQLDTQSAWSVHARTRIKALGPFVVWQNDAPQRTSERARLELIVCSFSI